MEEGEDGFVEFDEFSLMLVHGEKEPPVFGCCGDLRVTREMTLFVVGLATRLAFGLVGWPIGRLSDDATCDADGNTVVLTASLLVLLFPLTIVLVIAIDFGSLLLLAASSFESCMAAAALVSVTLAAGGCGQDELGVADVDVEELLAIETASVARFVSRCS